jgi:hypothetical protein
MFSMKYKWIGLFTILLLPACSNVSYFKHYEITKGDIPLYPNAQNVRTEENISAEEIYYWKFTTTDKPNKVWEYYKEYFYNRWEISDGKYIDNEYYSLSVLSCPFYTLKMEVDILPNNIYEINIIFIKEMCR